MMDPKERPETTDGETDAEKRVRLGRAQGPSPFGRGNNGGLYMPGMPWQFGGNVEKEIDSDKEQEEHED